MKFALLAVGLLLCGTAQAADMGQPIKVSPPPVRSVPPPVGSLPCSIPGHPDAMCFWQDPGMAECYVGPFASKTNAYPMRHGFDGRTVCWPGDARFFDNVD